MNTALIGIILTVTLLAAVWLGKRLRRLLPEEQLTGDSRDSVKQATSLVATMSALLVGLLVSSAQESNDTTRDEVIEVAAKAAFLDRVFTAYGPEAAQIRTQFHARAEGVVQRMWPAEKGLLVEPTTSTKPGDALFAAIQNLSPRDEVQHSLKAQAAVLASEIGQLLELLLVHATPSISKPLLSAVVVWLCLIFLSFGLLAPPNTATTLVFAISAFSIAGAICLILELDSPFDGWIQVSNQPILDTLGKLAR